MNKQNTKQTVLASAITIVAIAILGFFFWQNFIQNAPKAPIASDSWLKYTAENGKYSVSIPDGWKLTTIKGESNLVAWDTTDIPSIPGRKATVTTADGGRDGTTTAFYLIYNYTPGFGATDSPDLQKLTSFTTPQGVSVDEYSRKQTSTEPGLDIPTGAREYTYDLYKNNIRIHIVHDVLLGEEDQTSLIEDMIDTLKYL